MRTSALLRRAAASLTILLALLPAAACGAAQPTAPADGNLKIAASPTPHAQILRFVAEKLAPQAGLKIEVVEFTDYVQPNQALADGSVAANYFQHRPYLEEQAKAAGYAFTVLSPVHLEPLGLYSARHRDVASLPHGGCVAIPNDPSNGGRALRLLAAQGLITLKDPAALTATTLDIVANPKDLKITEVEAAQTARSREDCAAAVINGNYALAAKLDPAKDAIATEKAEGNPYANLLVVRDADRDNPQLKKLAELLRSPEVKKYIAETFHGAVVPA